MTENETLMQFPCDFPIKILGKNSLVFAAEILNITRKHFPDTPDEAIRHKPSRQGNYLAITVTVIAETQEILDALYLDLTKHPDVKMVL